MTSATLQPSYTCREAADKLNVSDARIRQLCIEHTDIGRKHGSAWLLTDVDIHKIQNLPEFGKRTRRRD